MYNSPDFTQTFFTTTTLFALILLIIFYRTRNKKSVKHIQLAIAVLLLIQAPVWFYFDYQALFLPEFPKGGFRYIPIISPTLMTLFGVVLLWQYFRRKKSK